MRIVLILSLLILMPLLTVPSATAEAKAQDTRYLPNLMAVWIACGAEDHPLVPDDRDPEEIADNPIGWLFSGEPECAYSDALNKGHETLGEERTPWGFGAAVHQYDAQDVGTLATASTDDVVFGNANAYMHVIADSSDGDRVASEGCGTQSIVLPDSFSHWQGLPRPPAYWWAAVDEVGVDEDLTTCFATTGTLHATWGA